jgi:hypothetical protein
MAEQQQWYTGKPKENMGLSLASDTEAYAGHLGKARELTKGSAESAIRTDSKESGAIWLENSALREAAFGNLTQAKQAAEEGLKLVPTSWGVGAEAALAFAMAGETARAESLAQDLGKRYPLDTIVHSLWLPATKSRLALDKKKPASALTALQSALPPIEFGSAGSVNISCLYPTFERGEAYLSAGQGEESSCRVSEDSRSHWHRLELLDGSVGASGSGSGQCLAVANLAGSGCRCLPRPRARRLQRLPHPLERRRSRYPYL